MKLSELRPAQEIHRESMRDPAYRRAYSRQWLPHQVTVMLLRLRVKARSRHGPG